MSSNQINNNMTSEEMTKIVLAYEKKWLYQRLVGDSLKSLTIAQRFQFMMQIAKIQSFTLIGFIIALMFNFPLIATVCLIVGGFLSVKFAEAWKDWAQNRYAER